MPPLFWSVRVPTRLAIFWRSLFGGKPGGVPRACPRSVIVFRLDAMGDVVMTTPLFRELKRAFPKSRCTVVVQRTHRPLLATNPHIEEILTPPEMNSRYLPRRATKLLAAWLLYWRYLRGRRFDIAISPRWEVDEHLAALLCVLTNATRRVGYTEKASPLKSRLNRGFDPAFNTCLPAGPVRHEVVRNLAVIEALEGTVKDSRLDIRLTERDRSFAAQLLASVPAATKVIALGIGAASSGRCWPLQRYAECVARLARQFHVCPVIVCSAEEREQGMRLEQLLRCRSILLCAAPLRQVCAVLERCHLFIGNDSGAAHLAAAMDCQTIVVSRHPRNGNPNHANSPLRFAPYCREAWVVQPATGLDACTDCCKESEPHCITAVSVDGVFVAARIMLGDDPAKCHSQSAEALPRVGGCPELPLVVLTPLPSSVQFGGSREVQG